MYNWIYIVSSPLDENIHCVAFPGEHPAQVSEILISAECRNPNTCTWTVRKTDLFNMLLTA